MTYEMSTKTDFDYLHNIELDWVNVFLIILLCCIFLKGAIDTKIFTKFGTNRRNQLYRETSTNNLRHVLMRNDIWNKY